MAKKREINTVRVALITGAAKRLGAAIALELHQQGYAVVLHYYTSDVAAKRLCQRLNRIRVSSAHLLQADLSKQKELKRLIERAVHFKGELHLLVNNASAFFSTPIGKTTYADWDKLMRVNLRAVFFLSQYALPYLRKTKGAIVNLADIHGLKPYAGHVVYSLTKAAIVMLTRSLAAECAPAVRVNAVAPGAVLWPSGVSKKKREAIIKTIPLAATGRAEDISHAVVFLASEASYITGQVLVIDGGRCLSVETTDNDSIF